MFLLTILVVALLFTGCNKMEYNPPQSEGKITEVLDEEENTIGKFIYDKNGFVKKSWFAEDSYTSGEKAEYTYTFDSEKRLIKKSGYEPGIIYMSSMIGAMGKDVVYSYEYNSNGQVEKITVDYDYPESTDLDFKRIYSFQYPSDSIVIEAMNNIDPAANSINSHNEYQFNSSGNIAAMLTYYNISQDEARINSKTECTYDNEKAPYSFDPQPSSKNNLLKKTITVYNYDTAGSQSIAYTSVYRYEYTYNNDNYPISQTETLPNGTEIVKYFKY